MPLFLLACLGSEVWQWLLHFRCFHCPLGSMWRTQEAWLPSCPKVFQTTLVLCPKFQKTWLHKMSAALKYAPFMALTAAVTPSQNRFITKALSKLQGPSADIKTAGKGCTAASFLCSHKWGKLMSWQGLFLSVWVLSTEAELPRKEKKNYSFVCCWLLVVFFLVYSLCPPNH